MQVSAVQFSPWAPFFNITINQLTSRLDFGGPFLFRVRLCSVLILYRRALRFHNKSNFTVYGWVRNEHDRGADASDDRRGAGTHQEAHRGIVKKGETQCQGMSRLLLKLVEQALLVEQVTQPWSAVQGRG